MAARYVNPTNVVAQGLDFYTGLPDAEQQRAGSGPGLAEGSYTSGRGGGGGNVMGRGSGGSAGVSADRTGSDSSKSWNYGPQLDIKINEVKDKDGQRGEVDPPKPEEGGINGPPVNPAKGRPRRPQQPAQEGEFVDGPEFPQLGRGIIDAPSWERGNEDALRSGELPALTGTTTPSLSGPVQPRQLVKEVPSSRRDRINLAARERTVVNRGLRDLGASMKEQHGEDITSEDVMPSSDTRWALAASRGQTR